MITSQSSPYQNMNSTLSRSSTPINSNFSKNSPIFSEKRQIPKKSIRRPRTESISSPITNNANNYTNEDNKSTPSSNSTPSSSQSQQKHSHHNHSQQQDYRSNAQTTVPSASLTSTSLMHWTRIKPIGNVPPVAIRAHSMTLVNEKIFIFGGSDIDTCYNDLYIFDAETYWWSCHKTKGICPPPRPCRAHTANLIGDHILIFGGGNGPNYFNTLYLLNVKTLTWERPEVRGQLPSPRRAHTAWVYNDLLYVFAGGDGMCALNDIYVLSKDEDEDGEMTTISNTNDTESPAASSMKTASNRHGNGHDGLNPNPNPNLSSSYPASPLNNDKNSVSSLNVNALNNSGNENSMENTSFSSALNQFSNSFENTSGALSSKDGGMSTPKSMNSILNHNGGVTGSHSGVGFTRSGSLRINGGNGMAQRNGSNAGSTNGTTDDKNRKKPRYVWTKLTTTGKAPSPRGYHSSNLVGNKVIIYGGSDGHECFSEIFILDLEKNHWTKVDTDRPIPRLSHTATQVGSYLFIIGGHDGNRYSHTLLLLNLVTLRWEIRKVYGEKPSSRGYHTAVLFDSRIFLYGGYDGHKVYNDMYVLDLSSSAYLPQITEFEIGVISNE